jgi:hypothetical protein
MEIFEEKGINTEKNTMVNKNFLDNFPFIRRLEFVF